MENITQTEEQQLKEYFARPDIQSSCLALAKQLNEKTRGNWFTAERILKKVKGETPETLGVKMSSLMYLGLAVRQESKGVVKFRITLKPAQRKAALMNELAELDRQRAVLVKEIESIKE